MKIAFWSNAFEQTGVSTSLAAISIASVIRYPYSVTVLENHLSYHNLGMAFYGNNNSAYLQQAGTGYYEGGGIEGLLRKIYRDNRMPLLLKPYLHEVIPKHLYYIPQSGVIHSELFDYEFNYNAEALFHLLSEYTDLSFVDTAHQTLSSKLILEEADLIVVNLYQNKVYLENFLENYSSLIPKAIFLVGNYVSTSRLSCRRIAKIYELPLDYLIPIPSNEIFRAACNSGCAVEFITSNYMCSKDNPNYQYIQAVRKAAAVIIKRAELTCGLTRKERIPCGR